ncbi:uncharacterized protein LOC126252257 [Schistocerca nitens]|uniref:uncharacterized protein LOC126252257 n=1 Tax=Schistocerca nitens TaxID=7011 RepID=UPI002118ECAE|nr:uncharacterized protein LOC126252257 [Schistocerca nitens]
MAVAETASWLQRTSTLLAPGPWQWAWLSPWAWLFSSEVASAYAAYNASAVSNSTDLELRAEAPPSPSALALYEHLSLPVPLPSAAHLGLATGLLLALFFNARRDAFKERKRAEAWAVRVACSAAWVAGAAAALPGAAALVAACALYRRLAAAVLACTTGRDFAGLLAGPDAVWAVEDDAARSVINVLATLQLDRETVHAVCGQVEDDGVDGAQLLRHLRSLLLERLQSGALPEKLLLLRRHSPLGYFYWQRRPQPLRLDAVVREHVRFLDDEDDLDEDAARSVARAQSLLEHLRLQQSAGVCRLGGRRQHGVGGQWCWLGALRRRLCELANAPLPQGHAAGWEVLVSAAPLAAGPADAGQDPLTAMEEGLPEGVVGGGFRVFPVLLRVHHSLGDGVALLHLLTHALSGSPQSSPPSTPPPPASEASFFQRTSCTPGDGRATPIICQVPTLRAMPATTNAWPPQPPASLSTETEHAPPVAALRPRSPAPAPDPAPGDRERDLAVWVEAARRSSPAAWAPPRPATPGLRDSSAPGSRPATPFHSAPSSRPATPFQCFIDAAGDAVSFTAAVNSRCPTQVGAGQCPAGDGSRPTSPLAPPDSPVKRPASPVPPYIPGVPASPVRRPPRRVLNGQTPHRPYSPSAPALTRLHCYSGGAAAFADDLCDSSCGLDSRGGTTVYYYSATDGSCRKLTRNFSHDDERSIAPDTPERTKSKNLARSVSFGPVEVLDGSDKETLPQTSIIEQEVNRNNNDTETAAVLEVHNSPVKKVNFEDSPEAKKEIAVDDAPQKPSLLVPAVKVEEVSLQPGTETEAAQVTTIQAQQMEPRNKDLPTGGRQKSSECKARQLPKFKLVPEGGQLLRVEAQLMTANGASGSPYAPLLQAISESSRSRPAGALEAARGACSLLLTPAALLQQALLHADHQLPCPAGQLSGDKVVTWLSEPRLLEAVRRVRRRECARFTDVLLAALAAALDRRLGPRAPRCATVVLPARVAAPEDRPRPAATDVSSFLDSPGPRPPLQNRFSVGLLPLPLAGASRLPPNRRLREVARRSRLLRASPDYQVNWWLMRVAASVLPTGLLGPALRSTRSSLVVSNLQGPDHRVRIAGHEVRDLVFWVPNRGSNGMGVSILSYAGGLQLGLQLDKAVALGPDDEARLLTVVAAEIHRMDAASRADH